ncbi:CopG family transcriptional regulator [Herbiconiux sp. P17]|uniref:CopG family transcriptional regulator n=1 Tax=Herbiconiux wuyangfengii TaxID=3342794 RepID=UPI0035B73D51
MKTAISVPDATFVRVDKRAAELGLNRSEFYTRAAELYLRQLDDDDLTARMNEAIARSGDPSQQEAREWAAISQAHLARYTESDEW